jgi:hypothetical protein
MIRHMKTYAVGVAVVFLFASIISLPKAIKFVRFGTLRQAEVLKLSCESHGDVLVKLYNSPSAVPAYVSVGNCRNLKVGDLIRIWNISDDRNFFSEESPGDSLRGTIIVTLIFSIFAPAILVLALRFRSILRPFDPKL